MQKIIEEGTKELGIEITLKQVSKFIRYKELLLEWNQKMNLTAICEEREIAIKHFIDSLTALPFIKGTSVIDVGTGAGFPGIPIKIMSPEINICLMDSTNKKILFLNETVKELELFNVECIHGRAEEEAHKIENRQIYDTAVSRAVARLSILAEYCMGYVRIGGRFIALKGPDCLEEIEEAKPAIKAMGGEIAEIMEIILPYSDIKRTIVLIDKTRQTPADLPRKHKLIAKSCIK